ncbi:4039_t:CDS:2, partial [Dentiscutata heterogama]
RYFVANLDLNANYTNFIAEERGVIWLDCQAGGGNDHHWRTLEDLQSEFGKVVHLKYVWWFDVSSTLKSVLPGTYEVVWRLKIDSSSYLQGLNFSTTQVDENDADHEQSYNHIPQSTTYANIARRNEWVEYCLPYRIVVPKRRIVDGKMTYHDIHIKIYNHDGRLKSGLWIDYIRLREHNENKVYGQFNDNSIDDNTFNYNSVDNESAEFISYTSNSTTNHLESAADLLIINSNELISRNSDS